MKYYFLLLALLAFDLLGLSLAKIWSVKNSLIFLILASVSYAIATIFLGFSLKYQGAAITNIIWVALSAIGMAAVGVLFFHESITPLQYLGIVIIMIGLIFVQIK